MAEGRFILCAIVPGTLTLVLLLMIRREFTQPELVRRPGDLELKDRRECTRMQQEVFQLVPPEFASAANISAADEYGGRHIVALQQGRSMVQVVGIAIVKRHDHSSPGNPTFMQASDEIDKSHGPTEGRQNLEVLRESLGGNAENIWVEAWVGAHSVIQKDQHLRREMLDHSSAEALGSGKSREPHLAAWGLVARTVMISS